MSPVPSRPMLSQCPACGLTVEETAGFKPAVWLKTHQKTCALTIGARGTGQSADAQAVKTPKRKKGAGVPSADPVPAATTVIAEQLVQQFASAFVKQMFKKGK